MPNNSAAASETPNVNRSTRPFGPTSRGIGSGPLETIINSNCPPHQAINTLAVPPMSASSRLSERSWRINLSRSAPSAARTAISRCRPAARANNRFAMFAHAIRSTRPTTTINISSDRENSIRSLDTPLATSVRLTRALCMSATRSADGGSPAMACSHCWNTTFVSAFASGTPMPVFKRPISHNDCDCAPNGSPSHGSTCACMASGIQKSGDSPTTVPKNSRAPTPMIVYTVALSVIFRPITSGFRAKRRSQNAWLITATGCPPGF
jgi:hypothetical protein